MTEAPAPRADRTLDVEGLKGLAHPLRVALLDHLSVHGPNTASGLGDALGESSGATSYHLRQLERHGFVNEVPGRGTGRERWWERTPGAINLDVEPPVETEASKAASAMIVRQWEEHRSTLLHDFLQRGESLGKDWMLTSLVTTANLRLTLEQAQQVQRRLEQAIDDIVGEYRGSFNRAIPGSRPVQLHVNLFPVVAGVPTPETGDDEREVNQP